MSEATPVQELICIGCPMGCRLQVTISQGQIRSVQGHTCSRGDRYARDEVLQVTVSQGQIRSVQGHTCARGDRYARDEVLQPRRMVTSLIAVPGSREPLSVKTRSAIPKSLIRACLDEIRRIRLNLPVRQGDVVLANVLDTGVDIVATRSLPDPDFQAAACEASSRGA